MYDEAGIKKKLTGMVVNTGQDRDIIFVEGGKDLTYGLSVHLDAISAARHIEGKLILVVSGDDNTIMDDIAFILHYNCLQDVDFLGVIINKVRDVEDFQAYFSVGYLVDPLFAKVISGENALDNVVENILVGAMSFIDGMAPLLTKDSGAKINLLQDLVQDKVNLKDIAGC